MTLSAAGQIAGCYASIRTNAKLCTSNMKSTQVIALSRMARWPLQEVSEEKDLGIVTTDDLKVSRQCAEIIQAWSPYLKKDIDHLEKKGNSTKLVYSYRKLRYEERLRRLGLITLQQRRLRGDLIETYKIVTRKERIETKNFFTFHAGKYNTRGHCCKLETRRSRLELRRNFFSQRVVAPWNKLPESVVTAESVNAFKNRLDKE